MNEYTFEIYEQIISIICLTIATGVGGFFIAKYKMAKQKNTALEAGVRALLRVQMIEFYDRYVEGDDILTLEMQNEVISVHEAYQGLGGNHGEERLFDAIMDKRAKVVKRKKS